MDATPCYGGGQRCDYDHARNNELRRSYPCHKCGNVFTRRNNLYNHLKFQCGQLPRFNCPYCSYRTRHSSNVRSHVRRMHPGQRVFVLDVRGEQECQQQWAS
ncbi:zinc finger X-chromosomal protein-like [Megalopta genalis]|uniref:zinc finger X-chromosomal protein-like n=1 Tax=Megalopta genalis TaxID=115081 RepID=UPI003FD0632C